MSQVAWSRPQSIRDVTFVTTSLICWDHNSCFQLNLPRSFVYCTRLRINLTLYNLFYLTYLLSYIDGSVQDCSNSTANALELLQSYTKPSILSYITLSKDTMNSPAVVYVPTVPCAAGEAWRPSALPRRPLPSPGPLLAHPQPCHWTRHSRLNIDLDRVMCSAQK